MLSKYHRDVFIVEERCDNFLRVCSNHDVRYLDELSENYIVDHLVREAVVWFRELLGIQSFAFVLNFLRLLAFSHTLFAKQLLLDLLYPRVFKEELLDDGNIV